jgi:EF-P beta-lysylation protein EpmB
MPFMASKDHSTSTAGGDWIAELARAVRDGTELCRFLGLPADLAAASGGWPVFVPWPYLSRIRRGDPHDPLLLQVLPRKEESCCPAGFSEDPLGEAALSATPGLLSKYRGRSLILATGACGVHCRFCFRRHFPFDSTPPGLAALEAALGQIAADSSIHEAILSGGDPLMLDDVWLGELVERLAGISHLRRVRVHTRLPVVIPSRVTPGLAGLLRSTRLSPRVVVHVNHPAEIDDSVATAFARLIDAGIPVMSQSVLLADVNDSADTLTGLFERLVDLRVTPYYLHQLDRIAGAAHFEVPEARGRELVAELRARLPGYAVPQYVREARGAAFKMPLE